MARCAYCGSGLHTDDYCNKTAGGQANRARLKCGYCGSKYHNDKACPKLYRVPRHGGVRIFIDEP